MQSPEHCPTADYVLLIATVLRVRHGLEFVEDQVSADVGHVVQVYESDLMARGVAFNLLHMAKRIGPQCEAAEYKDLSVEENLTLDRIASNDRRSHQALW